MKKFNWNEFGIGCIIGLLICLVTKLITLIVNIAKRKKMEKELNELKERQAFEDSMKIMEKRFAEDLEMRKARAEERKQINDKIDEIRKQLETETDIKKKSELLEELRRNMFKLTKLIDV